MRNKTESSTEKKYLDWLEEQKWTTLFIDGNCENFVRLQTFPEADMFDGVVGVIRPSVLHLKQRGHIYKIPDNLGNIYKCGCFGGAYTDVAPPRLKSEGTAWWKEEMPSAEEYQHGLQSLEAEKNVVDFIFSHEAPQVAVDKLEELSRHADTYDLTKYFQKIVDATKFKKQFFGHHHLDKAMNLDGNSYQALYQNIVEVL